MKTERPDLHIPYLVILFSGARFLHVHRMLKEWQPNETLYVEYLNRNIKRLECLREHCRYYMGKESDVKPVGFIFFPKFLLPTIEAYHHRIPLRRLVERAVKRRNLLMPKFIRIYSLREIKKVLGDNDMYKFIVSKFGELSVLARHYMYLLDEADTIYPKYIAHVLEVFGYAARPSQP